ncbi:unnamed protein product [Toxocara canis]|uniref:DNA-directed RNA polymerase n=1 Tax=Toxocara canis TaxID=6265 RepID=A0A183UZ70_TOXCA|nr:unnamed protein product [Toxocara canis]
MTYTHESMPGAQYYDGKKINIPITHEAGAELLDRWVTQCISSIMSSIASERSEQLNEFHRNRLFKCSNRAENVHEQARCVVDALDAQINKSIASNLRARRMKKLNELKQLNKGNVIGSFLRNYSGWRGELEERMDLTKPKYRKKRAIVRKTKYSLLSESGGLTPFGIIGKHFARIVTTLKKKAINQSWATITSEVENMQRKFHDKNTFEETLRKNFATLGHLSMSRPFSKRNKSKAEEDLLGKLRMLNTLKGSANMTEKMGRKAVSETNRLLHSAIQLAMILSKQNSTAIQQKTLKVASPRLLSIVPEDVQNTVRTITLSLFSPSLFSLHEHGNATEALFSLPSIIRALDNKDYEQWMNFVLEASGVSDVINFIKESGLNEIRLDLDSMPRGIDNQPLYFTKENLTEMGGEYERRKADIFESLSRALTRKQSADFKRRGFSVLTKDQLELVYGADSPYNDTKSLARFVSLTEADVHRHLMSSVRYLAKMEFFRLPSILGPVILSPWLFNPTIFSAHIIAPIILSPIAFSPYVLSPILLRPVVLAPQVLNPYILSPNVLSPYILSPTVLSPSILSPYALSPNVWQPTALRAIVLSPFVLSPSFCSPTFFVLTLLSPSALSPSINSTGTASASILSPSAFS